MKKEFTLAFNEVLDAKQLPPDYYDRLKKDRMEAIKRSLGKANWPTVNAWSLIMRCSYQRRSWQAHHVKNFPVSSARRMLLCRRVQQS